MSEANNQTIPERIRLRIRFSKTGPLRFVSHLDLQKIWERLLRRTGIPVTYSQGFSPHPQIQLAAALPLGYGSIAEIVDIVCTLPLPLPVEMIGEILEGAAPDGLVIQSVKEAALKHPALQAISTAADYRVDFFTPPGDLSEAITALMAEESLPRTKHNGKPYDLRPMILSVTQGEDGVLMMTLALTQIGGSGRPDDVIESLGLDPLGGVITRTAIHFSSEIS